MDLNTLKEWIFGLGVQYNVDPVIFGIIYVGAMPFFWLCIAWFIRNFKNKEPIFFPAFGAGFFFIIPYLYIIIAGNNVPLWVYGIITLMIFFGAYSTWKTILNKLNQSGEKL